MKRKASVFAPGLLLLYCRKDDDYGLTMVSPKAGTCAANLS
jgi:hypothetical protein